MITNINEYKNHLINEGILTNEGIFANLKAGIKKAFKGDSIGQKAINTVKTIANKAEFDPSKFVAKLSDEQLDNHMKKFKSATPEEQLSKLNVVAKEQNEKFAKLAVYGGLVLTSISVVQSKRDKEIFNLKLTLHKKEDINHMKTAEFYVTLLICVSTTPVENIDNDPRETAKLGKLSDENDETEYTNFSVYFTDKDYVRLRQLVYDYYVL